MLHLIVGENSYARDQAVAQIVAGRDAERLEGEVLEAKNLPDIFAGQTLFATERVIIISDLSHNKPMWDQLETWLEKLDDTTTLILVEASLDKRTRMYKALQKQAKVTICDFWKANEIYVAKKWCEEQARIRGTILSAEIINEIIARATRPSDADGKLIIDQTRLATVLDQLAHAGEVTVQQIDTIMAPDIHENIFALLSVALDGKNEDVRTMTQHLLKSEDGHKALGLLLSQVANLAALSVSGDRTSEQVAVDLGVNPFALRSLAPYARKLSSAQIGQVVASFADADMRVKRGAEAWSTIETALQKIALL